MATTVSQDRDFLQALIPSNLLEEAIDWIKENLEPDDVFTEKELQSWAENNGYAEKK